MIGTFFVMRKMDGTGCMIGSQGQTSMLELLIGTMLVLVVIIAILNSLQVTFSNVQSQGRFSDISRLSGNALQTLIRSPGMTKDKNSSWENQTTTRDINQFGLAKMPLVLSEIKVRKFKVWTKSTDYTIVAQKLGLGNYDFSLMLYVKDPNNPTWLYVIKDSQNHDSPYSGMGTDPTSTNYTAITLERSAILDSGFFTTGTKDYNISNEPIMVRLRVYAKQ